jgi:hypothetical protein
MRYEEAPIEHDISVSVRSSGVARAVHVGSSAPSPYTSAPTLYLTLCGFIACQ